MTTTDSAYSMDNRYRVDHSTALLSRLFGLMDTDTCDVTFVVDPAGNSRVGINSNSSSDDCGASGQPPGAMAGAVESATEASAGEGSAKNSMVLLKSVSADVPEPMGGRNRNSSSTTTVGNDSSSAADGGVATSRRGRLGRGDEFSAASVSDETDQLDERGKRAPTNSAPGPSAAREKIAPETTATATLAPSSTAPASNDNGNSGGVREFRCHRVLFAACSEYFRVLLYGGMSESLTRRVKLRDVAPEGFEAIVRYVYTGRIVITADRVMEIFSLAHRFGMGELLTACAAVLDECVNCDDVCRVLDAAEYYGHDELTTKCWDFIKDSTPRVLKSEGFLELSFPRVDMLVREAELQVDEADLFVAVQAWINRDPTERRRHVQQLSVHFRLPLMSLRELMSVVRPSSLVSAESLLDAVTYHSNPEQWSGDPLMIRPRGKRFTWDASSLAAGAWIADDDRTVTTSVGDWVGVYGNRVIRSGFHRWFVRANKLGLQEKKACWKAIIGVARPESQDLSRPYLPITGFVVGTGESKLGGNTAVDDYASVSLRDGDVVTVVFDADHEALTFFLNGASLGKAYEGISVPVVAALAVNSAGAMWSLDC